MASENLPRPHLFAAQKNGFIFSFLRGLIIPSLILALAAIGLGRIVHTSTDLPPFAGLISEIREVYQPAIHSGEISTWPSVLTDHQAGARAWQLGWLKANGQWDARVLRVANLALQSLAWVVVFTLLQPLLGWRWIIGLATGLLLLTELVPTADWGAAWACLLAALSLVQLACLGRNQPRAWMLGLGAVAGLANLLAATAGLAAAVALTMWHLRLMLRQRAGWRPLAAPLAINGALLLLGLGLALVRTGVSGEAFLPALAHLAAWPFADSPWAAAVWAPAGYLLLRWLRGSKDSSLPDWPTLWALWSVCQLIVLAILGTPVATAAPILLFGLMANLVSLAFLPVSGPRDAMRNLLLPACWGILISHALLHSPVSRQAATGPENPPELVAALRQTIISGEPVALRKLGTLSESEIQAALPLLTDADLRGILPVSIQPPLPVAPAEPAGFRADGFPVLMGREDFPAWGTWSAQGAGQTGVFVSQPMEAHSDLIQFRVCGRLQPPETSLVLRLADGTEIKPWETMVNSEALWKRINFSAPRGPFQIVARDDSAGAWLAFTHPTTLRWGGWLVGKVLRSWNSWLVGALLIGGLAMIGARQHLLWAQPERPPLPWSAVPWLALLAYAVFFSYYIDGTAGPNDSGGYLNSAKLISQGKVTGEPRMIWGAAAGETDITPYVPGTFRPTPDGTRMAPEYPVGFPLLVGLAARLTNLSIAVPLVTLVNLLLGVLFTRSLARAVGLPTGWDWLAGGIIGLSSVYLFQALQPQSDGPALVWVTAAIYWAWRSREKPAYAWLAGIATALAVMIRPSNVLGLLPILICLAGSWRQILYWGLAGAPFALWQAWYNHTLYGNALSTGYGDFSSGFALHFAPLTWKSYAQWLPLMFTPVVCLAPLGAALRTLAGRARAMLVAWVAVFMLFYTFYWCTYDNWYNMRFVMPAAPALVILGLVAVRWLTTRAGLTLFTRGPLWRTTAPTALLVVLLGGILVWDLRSRNALYWMHANRNYAVAGRWAREHFPANAVVFARPISGTLIYYTDLVVVRSDNAKARSPEFFAAIAQTKRPIFAVTSHWERKGYQWGPKRGDGYPDLPGRWERLATLCNEEIHTWAWHPEASEE